MKLDDVDGDDFQIEDRRGRGSGGGGLGGGGFPLPIGKGAGGIGAIVMLLIVAFLGKGMLGGGGSGDGGIGDVLGQLGGGQTSNLDEVPASAASTKDAQTQFVAQVGSLLTDYWSAQFEGSDQSFQKPGLVVFDALTQTGGCGVGTPEAGPFYCPGDQKIYIDFAFYEQLEKQLDFGGDFAMAYVIAHEYGHHIQHLLGITDKVGNTNADSVKVELQADCFAGAWGKSAYDDQRLESGDFDEAINAAKAVGDDAIQSRTQGRVDRNEWTHGSSADRQKWFKVGFDSGDPSRCDTFA